MKDTWHSDGLYIGGTWIRTHSPDRIDVVSPNTGVVIGSVPLADSTDVKPCGPCREGSVRRVVGEKTT